MTGFTANDVPDQTGKTIFITGANTGLGYEAAKTLAGNGARLIIGCRSKSKAEQARNSILADYPKADVMVKFKCDVHPWMFSYVGVLSHPYFAVTDADVCEQRGVAGDGICAGRGGFSLEAQIVRVDIHERHAAVLGDPV